MAKTKKRDAKKARNFATWVEEASRRDEWVRLLYDVRIEPVIRLSFASKA